MIDFYFDPISPYAWLAGTQLNRVAKETGLPIIAKPILFAGLLKAHGHMGPAEIPAKRVYTFTDVLRRAASYGLNVEGPPAHPFNPLLALRTATAIKDNEQRLQFAKAIMHAAWSEGKDITVDATVQQVLEACDLDPVALLAAATSAEVKQSLIDATEQAIALGIFGVPSFCYQDQLFWGDDRIDELLHCVKGRAIDQEQLSSILARKAAVKRKS